jgi:hypothetical protein
VDLQRTTEQAVADTDQKLFEKLQKTLRKLRMLVFKRGGGGTFSPCAVVTHFCHVVGILEKSQK